MTAYCHGNGADHCCYIDGSVCPYLETDTLDGRHWVCSLRRELASWTAVYADPRYIADVKPAWVRKNVADCGEFQGGLDMGPPLTVEFQCCFADQDEVIYNLTSDLGRGQPGSERRGQTAGEVTYEYGPGADSIVG